MSSFKVAFKNQTGSGKNKPDVERVQDLLRASDLLIFAYLIIDLISKKGFETPTKTTLKLLLRLTYLSEWLCHVSVIIICLFNKNMTHFLIPKTLSLAHSSSYLPTDLTV